MHIETFQAEQKAWTEKNFGVGPSDHPLLGLFEEFGELCHAELKSAQGIRGDAAKHEAAAKDAVGDIMIYFADYSTKRQVGIASLLAPVSTFEEVQKEHSYHLFLHPETAPSPQGMLFRIADVLGQLAVGHLKNDNPQLCILLRNVLQEVATYCRIKGWSLDAIVTETWAQVSQRDWTKNRETGA